MLTCRLWVVCEVIWFPLWILVGLRGKVWLYFGLLALDGCLVVGWLVGGLVGWW